MSVLDRHLQPDERVIYRTRRGWKAVAWLLFQSVYIVTWLLILNWALDDGVPSEIDKYRDIFYATLILGAIIYVGLCDYSRVAVVTERRVLKKTGVFTPKIEDLAITDVNRLSMSWRGWPRVVIVHGRNDRDLEIAAPVESDALCRAIAERAQVSAPAKRGTGIIAAGIVRTALGSVIPLVAVSFVFNLMWLFLDYQAPTDDRTAQIVLGLVAIPLFVLGPFSLLTGLFLANPISAVFVRFILSAQEAKRFFAIKWRAREDEKPSSGSGLARAINRLDVWLTQKLLSRLYGEPIRLED